ncbi:NAD-P-binding protein [Dendrothele bispora CBS 962.96]|uniref:NAD-P-binding protein n=1 Tax=Dendrothele bispora (strain CBS 962.96) TaxID=1314807 RepID=A0A4S8KXH3_DENBC|nr:NAD-P-binding protein [Dendrothele bispora CBS 962.96]
MQNIPQLTKAIIVQKSTAPRGQPVYHDAVLESRPIPALKSGEILVKMGAVAFNHRDVWIRKGLYPNIGFGYVFGADGAGTVVAASDTKDPLLNTRVFLSPQHGWDKHPDAPESPNFGVIGGVKFPAVGTFAEYVVVQRDKVIPSPSHLDDVNTAAWPLAGVTAWRATMINAGVETGHNVLISGVGGGVALVALQLCVAKGANVYVTSGSQEKIDKAKKLGAKGGANYKDKNWGKTIQDLLKTNSPSNPQLDSVIDAGGGDIMNAIGSVLKQGGRVSCYGMHANPSIPFTMRQVMRNQKLLGSTMGSIQDLRDATDFLSKHRIVPVVSNVIEGLESAEQGFELLNKGDQFGKVVIRVEKSSNTAQRQAKL